MDFRGLLDSDLSKFIGNMLGQEKSILMVGPHEAGKTTIAEYAERTQNISVKDIRTSTNQWDNAPRCKYKNLIFNELALTDLRSHEWRNLRLHAANSPKGTNIDGIVLVVDAANEDDEYLRLVHNMFHQLLLWDINAKSRGCPILILCNRVDHPDAPKKDVMEIREQLGFHRCTGALTLSMKEDIHRNSMLKCVPPAVMGIIMEYAQHFENGITFKWNPFFLQNSNLELIDRYFGRESGLGFKRYSYDECEGILQIICDYLPLYQYNDLPPEQYLIREVCASSGRGILKALDSFRSTLSSGWFGF